jgi:Arm DNA-binding domain
VKKNLNAVFIEGVKAPTSGRVTYWDQKTHGLGLRLSEGSRKSWVLYYRRQGQQRWLQLGTYPPLSLADARELAKDKLADVQKGGDPSSERRDARAAGTFAHLTERYLTEYAARNKKLSSIKEDTRNINRELVPLWVQGKLTTSCARTRSR